MLLDPKTITVKRDSRQRKSLNDITELKTSIKNTGQINPIIVRQDGEETILIAGEGRLRSCLELEIQVEVKFWNELSPIQAEVVELEENIKRTDLPWRDHVRSIARIHELHKAQDPSWNYPKTAAELGFASAYMLTILTVAKHIDSPFLKDSTGFDHAYGLLQRQADRRAAAIVGAIAETAKDAFNPPETSQTQSPATTQPADSVTGPNQNQSSGQVSALSQTSPIKPKPAEPAPVVLNQSFLEWVKTYQGPKFNLIHCDFPFGIKFTGGYGQEEDGIKYEEDEDTYWNLLNCLCQNTEKLASYSSHLVYWFSMTFYTETVKRLRAAGWKVQDHPLIWHKSDGQGIVPGRNEYPRRIYETALLCSRGSRPLVKMIDNVKSAPRSSNAIHPSQKPEPVLRHFFEAVVDSTTDMLDPTCGSGSALRAGEDVGARSVLGLELNPEFAKAANAATVNARLLRKAAR